MLLIFWGKFGFHGSVSYDAWQTHGERGKLYDGEKAIKRENIKRNIIWRLVYRYCSSQWVHCQN